MSKGRRGLEGCEIDMTPMIDVVFQLIIFFIVTINMEQKYNEEIKLEDGKNGPIVKGDDTTDRTMVIEINKRGWIYMHGASLSQNKLRQILKHRYRLYGLFPVLIRADKGTLHQHVKEVMDICTAAGLWQISFAAIKEHKTESGAQ